MPWRREARTSNLRSRRRHECERGLQEVVVVDHGRESFGGLALGDIHSQAADVAILARARWPHVVVALHEFP